MRQMKQRVTAGWQVLVENYFVAEKRRAALRAAWAGEYRLSQVFWLIWFIPFMAATMIMLVFFLSINISNLHHLPQHGHVIVPLWQKIVALPYNLVAFAWTVYSFILAYRVRVKCENKILGFFALLVLGLLSMEYVTAIATI